MTDLSSEHTTGLSAALKGAPGEKLALILIDADVVTSSDMEKALRIQQKLGNNKLLSSILIELGMISEDEQRRLIRKHGRAFRIGELVCELGYISLGQLRDAESEMEHAKGRRMGEILQDLDLINERQLAQALSEQLSITLLHLELEMVEMALVRRFSTRFMERNVIIPYEESQHKVSVIMADPFNTAAVKEIEQQLGKRAVLHIGAKGMITSVISKLSTESTTAAQAESKDHIAEVVDSIFLAAIRDNASDIHMEPMVDHMQIRFRMDGVLIHKMDMPTAISKRITARMKVLGELDISDSRRHQDGRISRDVGGMEVDFRMSSYVTIYGENLVMRVLRRDGGLKSLEQIHMSRGVLNRFKHDALDVPTGVIIITGPTGSGKTTTLYSAVDYLNRPTTKIITLEDPVEYVIPGIMQCSVDEKSGRGFKDSLKAVVRQDPDIIVLGEIRDNYSATVAVQAALTGHKVLTTFHTEDSIGGLLRLINMGIETFLISSTVVSILAQRLIRCICPDCKQPYMPNQRVAQMIGMDNETLENNIFYRGVGCGTCHGTGYHGRTALHELLVLNEDVRSAIIEQKPSHEVRRISCDSTDLLSLMEDGLYKVLKGYTTVEEVYRIAPRADSHRSVAEILRLMGE
ncbi:MAG: GspE/PulE family protein [Mariprofundaceae bacterium]